MATTTIYSLQLKFKDANDEVLSYSFSPAKASPSRSDVKALMNGMIQNPIWQRNPEIIVSAHVIERSVTDIDVSD